MISMAKHTKQHDNDHGNLADPTLGPHCQSEDIARSPPNWIIIVPRYPSKKPDTIPLSTSETSQSPHTPTKPTHMDPTLSDPSWETSNSTPQSTHLDIWVDPICPSTTKVWSVHTTSHFSFMIIIVLIKSHNYSRWSNMSLVKYFDCLQQNVVQAISKFIDPCWWNI